MNQRRELVCGLIAGVLGLVVLAMTIFAPLGRYDMASGRAGTGGTSTPITTTHDRRSLWSEGVAPRTKRSLIVVTVAFAAILCGTLQHAQWTFLVGLWLL